MKKFLLSLLVLFVMVGCDNVGNTPTKKVENYLHKYQTLDKDVLSDLDNTLALDNTITEEERDNYRDFMKKHYQDLEYEIKNETINGNSANVEVEVTVRDYSNVVRDANNYKNENPDQFNDQLSFSNYRLEQLKQVEEKITYTITFTLTKQDEKWILDQPSNADLNKINGLYTE